MASLQGNKIKDTYQSVLKTTDNAALDADGKVITDGAGNSTGITLDTQGNLSATGTVAFGSLKDTGEDITITKFVDETDGIANNDNDSSIPTSAAVRDYVDSYVTAQDLDISDGSNTGSIDLDSQVLTFSGDSGVAVSVSGQTVSVDSSSLLAADVTLQSNIDAEATARSAADTTLQTNINSEASARSAADTTLQGNIDTEIANRISADQAQASALDTEEAARIAGDAALQTEIDDEATARAAADTVLHAEIDAESSARSAADTTLQSNITAEATARTNADNTLQSNITAEATSRAAADVILQDNIDAEVATRTSEDAALQAQITSNDTDISGLTSRMTTAETNISSNDTDIAALDTRLTTAEGNITSNDSDISGLDTRLTAAESNISSNDSDISGLDTRLTAAEGNISSNDTDIAALDTRITAAEGNITSNDSDISGLDTRLTTAEGEIDTLQTDLDTAELAIAGKQSTSEKGQANGYASLDANGVVPVSQLPESVTGALEFIGTWNALTNTPTLPTPDSSNKGHYYKVSVEGDYLGETFHVGDWALSDGTAWEHIHTQETISDVFGRTGSISALEADYSAFYPLLSDLAATDANVLANTTKLATIESGADVTDATNVAAAGAMMTGVASLADLSDVAGTLPVNGQILAYNGGTGTWGPVAAATAPVTSVNGEIGAVTLDADDINDAATTNKFVTAADITKLGNIFVSQLVNLDTLESDTVTNNAKISFDSASSTKLAGIEAGADITDAANVTTALGSISVTAHSDVTSAGSGAIITSAERTKLQGIETGADVTDTANVVAALTAGTNITIGVDGTISATDTNTTYTAGSGLLLTDSEFAHADTSSAATLTASGRTYVTGLTFDDYGHVTGYTTGTETVVDTNTTYSAGTGLSLSGTTFSHADTSTQASVNNSGRTYIQDITLDTYGHVTAITSATETVVNTDTTYTAGSGLSLSGTTFSHADTSSAGNLAASGRRYVTGLTFDTYGHVTGYTTGTETVVDTNTTYSAGSGLSLSGTTFSLQSDLRGEAWLIGRDNNDYINVDTTQIDFVLDGAVDMRLYNNGDLHVEGNVIGYSTSISDQKFKDDVTPIESALDKVKALKGVEYTWNATSKKGKRDLGFIAQEVEQIIPEIVTEHTLSTGEFADNPTQSKTIDYEKITAVLVEAVKEQQKQIDELKAKLDGITK